MARTARPTEQIDAFRERILDSALEIMAEYGLQGLTMRRLADCIGTTAAAIYRYYSGKDEIYLRVRERGFNITYRQVLLICRRHKDPLERLAALTWGIKKFTVKDKQYYKVMVTWDIPLYKDFEGTSLEPVAYDVLQAAHRLMDLYTELMEEIAVKYQFFPKRDARLQYIYWLTELHGIVSLYGNSTIIDLYDDPDRLKDRLIERLLSHWNVGKKRSKKRPDKTSK